MNYKLFIDNLSRTISMLPAVAPLHLTIALGTIFSLGTTIPIGFSQQQPAIAQQLKQKKKVSPPPAPRSRGVPGTRTVSASMSGSGSCNLNLIALAPQFINPTSSTQTAEQSVWGQTIAQHPTFWFFIPATSPSTQLEFSLQNEREEDIYRTSVPMPPQPGTIGIKIPTSQQPLQINRNYRWTLKARVPCGTSAPNRVHVDGWVTRVNLPGVSPQSNSDSYAQNGLWYDAVTSLAQQRLQKPNDLQIEQDWSDLLESDNLQSHLQSIAKQPLLLIH